MIGSFGSEGFQVSSFQLSSFPQLASHRPSVRPSVRPDDRSLEKFLEKQEIIHVKKKRSYM